MTERTQTTPANDDTPPKTFTLTELVAASGLDADTLLQRLAGVYAQYNPQT